MRTIFFMSIFVVLGLQRSNAQTLGEWTRQGATQKKYLMAQIVANGAFAELLSGGYGLARYGLAMVGDLSRGEYSLHRRYFDSLSRASPGVRSSWYLKEIQEIYGSIARLAGLSEGPEELYGIPGREASVLQDDLYERCAELLDALIGILRSDGFRLSDYQRIQRIEKVHGMVRLAHRQILEQQLQNRAIRYLQQRDVQQLEFLGRSYRFK